MGPRRSRHFPFEPRCPSRFPVLGRRYHLLSPRFLSIFSRDTSSYGLNHPLGSFVQPPPLGGPPVPTMSLRALILEHHKVCSALFPLLLPFHHPTPQHLSAAPSPHPHSLCPSLFLQLKALAWLRLHPPALDHCLGLLPGHMPSSQSSCASRGSFHFSGCLSPFLLTALLWLDGGKVQSLSPTDRGSLPRSGPRLISHYHPTAPHSPNSGSHHFTPVLIFNSSLSPPLHSKAFFTACQINLPITPF